MGTLVIASYTYTLDFCPRQARKDSIVIVPLIKNSKELTVLIHIYCGLSSALVFSFL